MTTNNEINLDTRPRQADVLYYVERFPGCTKCEVARFVGPNGSLRYGYRTVDRAIANGLIRAEAGERRGTYALYPAEVQS